MILYAEDDLDDFDFFRETLETVDPAHACINVLNGKEVLDFLENAEVRPDLIFMDINMPILDGRSCLKEIKKDDRFKSIPVFIFTTNTNPRERDLCMELGASGFLQKPTHLQAAIDQLKNVLTLSQ